MNADTKARVSAELDANHAFPVGEEGHEAPTHERAKGTAKQRGPSVFTVVDVTRDRECGHYQTLDEARGCVTFDRLSRWEIWQGDHIVEEGAPTHEVAYIASAPATGWRMPTLESALGGMWDAQADYSRALTRSVSVHAQWATCENISSRERYAATLRLMDAMKISSTAADKIATQDAEYARFRDGLTRLATYKAEAEADVADCLARLISARVTCETLVAMARNTPSAKPETILDRQRTIAKLTPEERDELRAILDGHAHDDAIATGDIEPDRPSRGDLSQWDTLDEKRGRN